ncbi:MAG: sigma-70 family RNA polymerase sigma factor [Gemmatimonadota bacterium]
MGKTRELPEVVAAINRRDPAALERIARTHLPALLRCARAAGTSDADAYDVVQDALLVFVRRAADFDGRVPVAQWLIGIVYRTVQARRRVSAREETPSHASDPFDERFDGEGMWSRPPQSPESYTASAQAMTWLNDCLDKLSDRRRLAFVMREVDQMETNEICNILGTTANTLGVLLFRARNALRECLESKGIRGSSDVEM